MKHILITCLLGGTCLVQPAAQELTTDEKRLSYSIGMNIGQSLQRQGVEADLESLFKGIEQSFKGEELLMTQEEARQVQQAFQQKLIEKRNQQATANAVRGKAWLEENKQNESVQETDSGLQYKIIEEGTGPSPRPSDTVTVHYRGRTIDGKEFDSSYSRGEPAKFRLDQVIKGWTEGLQLMKEGGKAELYIPANLGYGPSGTASIGANETLIFEVELIDVPEQPRVFKPKQPVTSDIIKVPSAEELKKGAKIEVLKPEDVERIKREQAAKDEQKAPKDDQ